MKSRFLFPSAPAFLRFATSLAFTLTLSSPIADALWRSPVRKTTARQLQQFDTDSLHTWSSASYSCRQYLGRAWRNSHAHHTSTHLSPPAPQTSQHCRPTKPRRLARVEPSAGAAFTFLPHSGPPETNVACLLALRDDVLLAWPCHALACARSLVCMCACVRANYCNPNTDYSHPSHPICACVRVCLPRV